MQHSHEALDRSGGFARRGLLTPLRRRDFRLLWSGMAVSLVGDGIFLLAIAWESYDLWNAPAALSIVGLATTVPMIVLMLPAGVAGDRLDRRYVMLAADAVRAVAVAALAVLAIVHALAFWELAALVAVYSVGTSFFVPSYEAILPDLLDADDLPAANSLDQLVRPVALRLVGPLVGGFLVAAGAGVAFLVDAVSFAASFAAVASIAAPRQPSAAHPSPVRAVAEGLVFVRRRAWLWGTLATAALAYLVFLGPTEVLLPYLVKNDLHATADALGLVFAAGGVGAIGAGVWMGRHGHPRRDVTVMYATWTVATLAVAGYGLATATWQLMAACLVFNALETAGTIVWATMKQRHVPGSMLSRVSSLDWLISIALLPVSFALTAPVAAAVGARATLVGAGLVGGALTLGALLLPGMRDIEDAPGEAGARVAGPAPVRL